MLGSNYARIGMEIYSMIEHEQEYICILGVDITKRTEAMLTLIHSQNRKNTLCCNPMFARSQ